MNDFTASNGIGVEINDEEQIVFAVPNRPTSPVWMKPDERVALREFFRAEEDERLGRWRWPENPDYVVYAWVAEPSRGNVRGVTVLSERIPRGYTVWEDNVHTFHGESVDEESRRSARDAARAYFDAHPERKPWHDAKPGETWRLTVNDRSPLEIDLTFNVIGVEGVIPSRFARPQVGGEQMEYPLDSPAITAGRRIWPEVSS